MCKCLETIAEKMLAWYRRNTDCVITFTLLQPWGTSSLLWIKCCKNRLMKWKQCAHNFRKRRMALSSKLKVHMHSLVSFSPPRHAFKLSPTYVIVHMNTIWRHLYTVYALKTLMCIHTHTVCYCRLCSQIVLPQQYLQYFRTSSHDTAIPV